ncbi:MAG: hypothetical protein IKJ68_08210 [Clostridia bacterium]|nr:hypothetical protein [Clostridia bacterium]
MKMPEKAEEILISKRVYIYIICIFLTGFFLMLLPDFFTSETAKLSKDNPKIVQDNHQVGLYTDSETKLKEILQKVEGVGKLDLIINYKDSNPVSDSAENKINKYVLNDQEANKNETGKIEGVVIVAEGGGDDTVVNVLRGAVSGYLGIPVHKVNVLKMDIKETN